MTPEQRTAMREKLQGPGGTREVPFAKPESLTKVYAVASGKGGVGKSSVTANLAAALAAKGLRVGLVDADRLRRRIDRLAARPDAAKWRQLVADVDKARARLDRRRASVPILRFPDELPVSAARDEIAEAIRNHQVVVIAGGTGSGKTTQLPKICLELGRGIRG